MEEKAAYNKFRDGRQGGGYYRIKVLMKLSNSPHLRAIPHDRILGDKFFGIDYTQLPQQHLDKISDLLIILAT